MENKKEELKFSELEKSLYDLTFIKLGCLKYIK